MLKNLKAKVLNAKNAIYLSVANTFVTGVSCDLLKNDGTTAWNGIQEFYNGIFWPVWGIAWILFVWGPAKFKEIVKGVLIMMPVVLFILNNKTVIADTLNTFMSWFGGSSISF